MAEYLRSHAGGEYTVVAVERDEGRFSLIVDSEWVELARAAQQLSQDLVDDIDLPRNAVLAVVGGWISDWSDASADLTVEFSKDHIPHLCLTSLLPTRSDAGRNPLRQ